MKLPGEGVLSAVNLDSHQRRARPLRGMAMDPTLMMSVAVTVAVTMDNLPYRGEHLQIVDKVGHDQFI